MLRFPYLDSHCDTVSRACYGGKHLFRTDCEVALDRREPFSAYVQLFAIFLNTDTVSSPSCLGEFYRMRDFFLRELSEHPESAAHCRSRREVGQALAEGKAAAMLSIEDSALLDCDPDQLPMAAELGIQTIALTWNHRNAVSGSCADCPEVGLSDRGRAFVRDSERLGILMDVSHLSPRGFWDLFEMAERPIVATHSNAASVHPHIRNLTDDQFRAIAESGGVAGLNFFTEFIGGTEDLSALIRHLEHYLELGGEDHVGIGSDFDGCRRLCAGIERNTGVANLRSALKDRGYGDDLLQKLFFDNWMRLIREA